MDAYEYLEKHLISMGGDNQNVSQRGVNYTEAFNPSVVAYTSISDETKTISKVWEFYPCWSLGALLKNLPEEIEYEGIKYRLWFSMQDISYYSVEYEVYLCCTEGEPIDACIEMYRELKKRNLI